MGNLGKARRFATGRPGRPGPHSGGGPAELSALWTETAEERKRRLADEVLGRTSGSKDGGGTNTSAATARLDDPRRDEHQAKQIRDFTEQSRGKSLYETHREAQQEGKKPRRNKFGEDEEEDDPSKRAFDKEKDMALSRKINTAQRRELVNRAADFGGRFTKGKFL